jgi:hypothetical protein
MLAHAHERGVVHRDGARTDRHPEGRAKVLDFLAKRAILGPEEPTRTLEQITERGSVAGTPSFMAPEVLRGEPADARSDLWALGVMLYEAVTGTLPFRGTTTFEITSAILRDSMAPLPAHVPPGLAAVIQRLLAKQPGERYQQAGGPRGAGGVQPRRVGFPPAGGCVFPPALVVGGRRAAARGGRCVAGSSAVEQIGSTGQRTAPQRR